MQLHELHPAPGSRPRRHRVGRGIGSGWGKRAGRGQKGQKSRSGGVKGPYFEGGQTPLQRRLPKRGFVHASHKVYALVDVGQLGRFPAQTVVTPEVLVQAGLVKAGEPAVKILGDGELHVPLTVRVHKVSRSAAAKIEEAGGKVEVI
ncbi:MAG: 50S ribosomal protein L15 [Limnochordaceae bacterium]|nr:50S ribosomal protein L15 [Limnochordaceae bacterium]